VHFPIKLRRKERTAEERMWRRGGKKSLSGGNKYMDGERERIESLRAEGSGDDSGGGRLGGVYMGKGQVMGALAGEKNGVAMYIMEGYIRRTIGFKNLSF